jgi:hypothetical protein
MKTFLAFAFLSLINSTCIYSQQEISDAKKYLGQKPPGLTPEIFAPGLVSIDNRFEYGSTFSPDDSEFYFAVNVGTKPEIQVIKFSNNAWTKPSLLIGHAKYGYNDPFPTPDGKKLFFISDRPLDGAGEKKDIDIWYVNRTASGWSDPINAGSEINSSKNEYYISFTKSGIMYFSSNGETSLENDKNYDIKTSTQTRNSFNKSSKLGPQINSEHYEADVFVAPDESYLIYCSERPNGKGSGDLYISFKDSNGTWMPAKIIESGVSTDAYEFCPYVSNDGKYFFFSRSGDIYWVSAQILKRFK